MHAANQLRCSFKFETKYSSASHAILPSESNSHILKSCWSMGSCSTYWAESGGGGVCELRSASAAATPSISVTLIGQAEVSHSIAFLSWYCQTSTANVESNQIFWGAVELSAPTCTCPWNLGGNAMRSRVSSECYFDISFFIIINFMINFWSIESLFLCLLTTLELIDWK
jgi:hypothetical protein